MWIHIYFPMNLFTPTEIHGLHHPQHLQPPSLTPPNFLSLQQKPVISLSPISPFFFSPRPHFSPSKPKFNSSNFRVLNYKQACFGNNEEQGMILIDDLTEDGEVYKRTLRLVECSMFAALGGLAYILSSSLAIEVCQGKVVLLTLFRCGIWSNILCAMSLADCCFMLYSIWSTCVCIMWIEIDNYNLVIVVLKLGMHYHVAYVTVIRNYVVMIIDFLYYKLDF